MNYTIECEQEVDGRWLAEVIELPGMLAYGATKNEAIVKVESLALCVNAEFDPKSKAHEAWQALAASRRNDVRSGKVSMVLGSEALWLQEAANRASQMDQGLSKRIPAEEVRHQANALLIG